MKKILILFCGGTITMQRDEDGVLQPVKNGIRKVEEISQLHEIATIDMCNVVNMDSSNMDPKIWTDIAGVIHKNYGKYDGFVVIHGTDTMAYTASALSFIFGNLTKPVVFTGAQKPLTDLASDAVNNLINATLIATMLMPEVIILFGSKVLRANRSTKVSESSLDAFDSPMYPALGEINSEIKIRQNYKKPLNSKLIYKPDFDNNVIVLDLFPGLDPATLKAIFYTRVKGIILKAFGPGNVPDVLLPILKDAAIRNIPVVVLSQCQKGITKMQLYKVGVQAKELGAIAGSDMTLEAAVTKLMWLLANTEEISLIKKLFIASLAGEVEVSKISE